MREKFESKITEPIPVFVACDRKYLPHATTLCLSILKHTRHRILFHVLHDGSLRSRDEKLTGKILSQYENLELVFRKLDSPTEFRTWTNRFPPIVYYRLLIPLHFRQYDKCIYLDSDMLVNSDISELYETDLHGRFFGAVPDYNWMESYQKNEKLYGKYASIGLQEYCRQIHLPHPEHYFNSGLILMDLKAIRSSGLELLKTACAHAGEDFLLPDQDLMNLYLSEKILPVAQAWNYPIRHLKMPEAKIYHYIGKPWHNSSADVEKAFYWNALKETPYFYQVRAEMLIYEIEASINSNWRYATDSLIKAGWRFGNAFIKTLRLRFISK